MTSITRFRYDGRPFRRLPDSASTPGVSGKARAESLLAINRDKLADLQYRLWAERKRSVLLVLQGMDTSGKDGVVRHVITGMNPTGVRVVSFKKPSEEETGHDFLWRIHKQAPARGEIVVFNRSHYEDVLIVRVKGLAPRNVWKERYEAINEFERVLSDEGTRVVKVFLHISKNEQKERLLARLEDPKKNWKFEPGDVAERRLWDDYQEAYEAALRKCGTRQAPWWVVPADKKWYRDWLVSEILLGVLEEMNPKPPKGKFKTADFQFE